jgi:succinate dehydrogenase/fumarate reductase cytochrome b subunit
MNVVMTLFTALLFVLLVPGVVLSLPPKGSLLTKAIVHGLVFALVYHLTYGMVWQFSTGGFMDKKMEYFSNPKGSMCGKNDDCASKSCVKNMCA